MEQGGGLTASHASAPARRRTRVAVIEEDDLLRYGLVGCLREDKHLDVTVSTPHTLDGDETDVAIVSSRLAREHCFPCPIIIYGDTHTATTAGRNDVAGALHRSSLTVVQLHATVHAAAAGLRVNGHAKAAGPPTVDLREIRLLELIADGHTTREIAELMSYSERTIKKLIMGLEDRLNARSRPQIVAQAIRRGLI